jgi:hypothetical protein
MEAVANLSIPQLKERIKENKEEHETLVKELAELEELEAFANLSLAQMEALVEAKKQQDQQRDSKQIEAERIVAEKAKAEQPVAPNAKKQKQMDQERRRKKFADDIKTKHNIDIDPSEFTFKSLKQIFQTGLIQEKKGSKKHQKILEYGKTHENQKFDVEAILHLFGSSKCKNRYTFVGSTKGLLRNPPLKAYLNKKGYSIVFGSNSDNDMSDGEYKIIKL